MWCFHTQAITVKHLESPAGAPYQEPFCCKKWKSKWHHRTEILCITIPGIIPHAVVAALAVLLLALVASTLVLHRGSTISPVA